MSEIYNFGGFVDENETEGDQAINTAERKAIDRQLQELIQVVLPILSAAVFRRRPLEPSNYSNRLTTIARHLMDALSPRQILDSRDSPNAIRSVFTAEVLYSFLTI